MIHEILPVGMLACNCSIIGDEETREGIVIDPGDDVEEILHILERHGLRLTTIVVTHAHIDHIGGAQKLKQATGAVVYMSERDIPLNERLDIQAAWLGVATPERAQIDMPAREGDRLRVGPASLVVLNTPGHTPGSISLWIPEEKKLIAGDTLFREGIGRTDLPGGDSREILRSISDKFLPLPEETVVVPGHGELTTLGHEKEFNYFLQGL
ncbi:MAG: MBL fold metallo-hydrolase [Bryobacteraceae bacterium]|jgi:glyoxylase-like metal-dependent hydrolase (beta-lactamase superfamily II)